MGATAVTPQAVVAILAATLCFFYTAKDRSISIIAGAGFMFLETGWTGLEARSPFGGSTTWVQFWANVIYSPVLLVVYRDLVTNVALRVFLYPLNVWLLEIVVGYALIAIFGRNTAWFYSTPDARFHGNIRLAYLPVWWMLGGLVELTWDAVMIPAAAALEPYVTIILVIAVPLTFVTERVLGWPRIVVKEE